MSGAERILLGVERLVTNDGVKVSKSEFMEKEKENVKRNGEIEVVGKGSLFPRGVECGKGVSHPWLKS